MKKLLKLILGIIMICISLNNVNAIENSSSYEEYLNKNWEKVQLSTELQNILKEEYKIKDIYSSDYPKFYGGVYISDDSNYLVVQIVKNIKLTLKDKKCLEKIKALSDKIKVEYVQNSFNTLNKINNEISNGFTVDEFENISGSYIDVLNNVVQIETDKRENIIKLFDNKAFNIDSEVLNSAISVTSSKNMKYYSNLNAGAKYIGRAGECSTGFRTRYNGKDGFVTAGHCVKSGKTGYVAPSISVGSVEYVKYDVDGKYDYAFVATNSSYTPTNNLAYTSNNYTKLAVANYCPAITVNMAIGKVGNNTKYTTGKVKGLNQSINATDDYENVIGKVYGLVKTNTKAGDGDSGGVVFIPRADSTGGSIPIGIVSGGNLGEILGIGQSMYFTSIDVMPSAFQTGRY